MKTIFMFDDYREFILYKIEESTKQKGYRGLLAQAAQCQASFFSQAIQGKVQFTVDHLSGLAEFWHLNESETEFFIYLLLLERASNKSLRQHCKTILNDLRKKNTNLAEKLQYPALTQLEDEAIYYSSWLYPAIHIATSIPNFGNIDRLVKEFGIKPQQAHSIVKSLQKIGLIEHTKEGGWTITNRFLHLAKNSPFFAAQHMNWRFRCIEQLQKREPDKGVNYTSVISVSKKDIPIIEEEIVLFIKKLTTIISASKEEELYCLCLDFFKGTV